MMTRLPRRAALLAAGLLAAPAARAQALAPTQGQAQAGGFAPTHPIRVIVPYPPGGVTDLVGRVVADGCRDREGWPAVVENKPGASGQIGMAEAKRARPDGETLLIGGFGSHVLPPAVTPNYPFDIPRDFTPVARLAEFVNVLVVNPASPWHSVSELVAAAKARPGELNFGSSGTGASNHMTAELFALETGTRLTHIPGQGANTSIVSLRAGDIQLIFENMPAVLGQIRDGALRALAVTSAYRSRALPEVPTLAESGWPGIDVSSWIALYGPPGLPAPLRDTLAAAAVRAVETEPGRERLERVGFEIRPLRGDAFTAFQNAQLARWRDVVARAGVRPAG
ncbi:tripartite tricarboxylate transporter substrate binding protein [Roseomonas sp. NAR14]|uniref:Tripartite tricarboxylate transporter substrate binding protein n=1 Tax=Roseomonas acroporae TaxID=2937791 RepID=A0A9X1Y3Q8_9PROT|nr:tripartite tricarboxylate transporter substrate binding protein [Roseomonas acroporae]MCK8783429.1 tripartite tricarboxylate transporter substrate binding protein [Roseomonas acroporae]